MKLKLPKLKLPRLKPINFKLNFFGPRRRRNAKTIKLTVSPFEHEKHDDMADRAACALISAMLFLGIGAMPVSMLRLPVFGVVLAAFGFAVTAFILFFKKIPQKKKLIISLSFAAVLLVFTLIMLKYFRAGIYITLNHISEISDIENMRINSQYEVSVEESAYKLCVTLFLLPLCVLLSALCTLAVRFSRRAAGGAALAVIAAVGVFEAVNHAGAWSALLCAAVALLICRSLCCSAGTEGSGRVLAAVCAVMLSACSLGSLAVVLLPGDALSALGAKLERGRIGITEAVHRLKYESDTYLTMPEGDFYNIKQNYSPTNETALEVTMSGNESVYLRGYVGEVYTENGWRPIDKNVMNSYTGLFYQLHKNKFYPQLQLSTVASILDKSITADSAVTVDIDNTGACRAYMYAPYELARVGQSALPENYIGESKLYAGGVSGRKYSYTMLPNQVSRQTQLDDMLKAQSAKPSGELGDYLAMEAKYRSFVYSQYTAISKEDSDYIANYIGDAGVAGETHISYDDAKKRILQRIGEYDFMDEVQSYDGSMKFVRFVLREMQGGYSPHFATITVLMLRHYGIPARYVEGYVITPDDVEENDAGEPITITDGHAHAWAEYYHDGIGWLPFETDPSFVGVMEGVSDPPPSVYGDPEDGTGSPEDEIDPPEHKRHEKDPPKANEVFSFILPWLLFVLLLAAAALGLWYRRKMLLAARKDECDSRDNSAAVRAMMEYMLLLLREVGIKDDINSPAGLVERISESWGSEWGEAFGKAMIAYLKASFSSHILENDEKTATAHVMNDMTEKVDCLINRRKRLVLRYIKCLY